MKTTTLIRGCALALGMGWLCLTGTPGGAAPPAAGESAPAPQAAPPAAAAPAANADEMGAHEGRDHSHGVVHREGFDFGPLESIPVQDEGMAKSLYTFADETMREVAGETDYGHRGVMENFFSMVFEPQAWGDEAFLKINHPELKKIFGKKHYISPLELESKRDEWLKLIQDEKTLDHAAVKTEVNHIFDVASRTVGKEELVRIVPQVDFKGEVAKWWTVDELASRAAAPTEAQTSLIASWKKAKVAFLDGRAGDFNAAAAEIADSINKLDAPNFIPAWKVKLDMWNGKIQPFRVAAWVYLIAALVFLVAYLAGKKMYSVAALTTLGLGAAFHVAAIVIRGILAGRTPVANLFEASTFIIGMMAVLSIIISIYYQTRVVGLAGATLGAIFMGFANNMPLQYGVKVLPLIDALQSYWLRIHVTSMLTSYAFFALSFFVAVSWLARRWWLGGGAAAAAPASSGRRGRTAAAESATGLAAMTAGLDRMIGRKGLDGDALASDPGLLFLDGLNFRIITIGFPILTGGVILGAVWAAEAWGRPWGFDPKETAAAITWMIYAIFLHARLFLGWRGSKGIWMSILGFAAVVFTYLGVSFFLPGLHSYVSEGTSFSQWLKSLFH